MADGGAVAVAVIVPVVVGGGGFAIYKLTQGAAPPGRGPIPTLSPPIPQSAGGGPLDSMFGSGSTEAVGVLANAFAQEGSRAITMVAKGFREAGELAMMPGLLAVQGTKQVMTDVKAGASSVYRDVRSGVGTVYQGTKTVAKDVIKYSPVSLAYRGTRATLGAVGNRANDARHAIEHVASKLKFW